MAGAAFWGLNDQGASSNEAPDYFTDPWDTFWLGGLQLPGLCELRGAGGIAQIDLIVKKAKGHTGARVTFGGYAPKQFEVGCTITTPSQWDIFQDVCDQLWRGPKASPKDTDLVLDVRHPDLLRLKVHQAALIGTPPAVKGPLEGEKTFVFRFQEYVEPTKKKTVTATSSVSVVEPLRFKKGTEPENAPPPPPSSNKENLALSGPPAK